MNNKLKYSPNDRSEFGEQIKAVHLLNVNSRNSSKKQIKR
jgi:hypothetical protein